MTPAAAIRAATIDAATLLDRAGQLGSIEPGKSADIIAVATSPLDDVTVLERVRFVMRQGVVHVLDGARQAFPVPLTGSAREMFSPDLEAAAEKLDITRNGRAGRKVIQSPLGK